MSNLIIMGFKAAGKTTLGILLAQKMQKEFFDTDREIAQLYFQKYQTKKTPFEIFSQEGEEVFRKLEGEVIGLLSEKKNCILSLGGGTLILEENRRLLKKRGLFIYLKTPFSVILKRLEAMHHHCFSQKEDPALEIEMQWDERKVIFEALVDISYDNTSESMETLIERIYNHGK